MASKCLNNYKFVYLFLIAVRSCVGRLFDCLICFVVVLVFMMLRFYVSLFVFVYRFV